MSFSVTVIKIYVSRRNDFSNGDKVFLMQKAFRSMCEDKLQRTKVKEYL